MEKKVLDSGWLATRSTEMSLTGIQLTTSQPPKGPTGPWVEASIPGTVLGTLVKNKLVPDPFYGLNNEAIIDIADSGREYYTFWFFTTFKCTPLSNQHVDLNFRAINYSAEVYLNGHKEILPKGMFRRHILDISDILNPSGDNLLAVLVHPPDHPGEIPAQGGQGGDHAIGQDVAAQYVEGWDWMCPIRDRNTGIWDEVSVTITGPVKIIDPHLVSTFFDGFNRAYLHSTIELQNKSTWDAECTVTLQCSTELEGTICLIEHLQNYELTVPAKSTIQYTLPPLFFYKPNLWWPNGMGKQSLYNVEITINVKGFGESDSWSHNFGFRKVESTIDSKTGGRLFKVNGQPVFIRGGNWILSDGLLRLSKERYKTDIKFHADMNFNMLRCWGGGLAERPDFYHFCDIYGLLVWQEFWITGDVDGRGDPVSNPDGPLDHNLFLLCAKDTVKLLRNHASLALWVGGNEQVPPPDINSALKSALQLHPLFTKSQKSNEKSTDTNSALKSVLEVDPLFTSRKSTDITNSALETMLELKSTENSALKTMLEKSTDINSALKTALEESTENSTKNSALKTVLEKSPDTNSALKTALEESAEKSTDPSLYLDGTRVYVQGSMWDGFADGKGNFTDGPYEIQNPEDFFKTDYYKYGFNPEVGSVGMPVAATIRATMPREGWGIPVFKKVDNGFVEEVPNPIWEYHKYIPYSKPGKVHDRVLSYGYPKDLDDFCEKAQLVNYEQYRALLEGYTSKMWTKHTGVLIWKTQNPWTGLRGQFYDHLLDQTAGFYGCRSANEPVHVQLNLATYFIEVVNTTSEEFLNIAIEISVWDLDGNCPFYKVTDAISVPPKKVEQIIEMKYPKSNNAKPVYFLLLKLFNLSDKSIISRNFYWLHLTGKDYVLLEKYRSKKVPLKITSDVLISGLSYKVKMSLENLSKNSTTKTLENNFNSLQLPEEVLMNNKKQETSLWTRIFGNKSLKTYEINGSDTGVVFFLNISVHKSGKELGNKYEDTRLLPVHYTDNYFSLVPGEKMNVNISFEVPQGVTPRVVLTGWNYNEKHVVL